MSNVETEDKELEELRQQIEQKVDEAKDQAAEPAIEPETPSPEPIATPASEAPQDQPPAVTPNQSTPPKAAQDDPMEWAKRKGYKSPEDMARELLKKDQDYHASKKAEREAPQAPPPSWNPAPDMGYGYPPPPQYGYPPPQPRLNPRDIAAYYPQLAPEDVERILPLVLDATQAVSRRERASYERELGEIRRSTRRNNELMNLMQDPAFRDERVQREIHAVLDANPNLFQRDDAYTQAFKDALGNLARKQLQQGFSDKTDPERGTKPPVTAGGGNGSANTAPLVVTPKMFDSWTDAEQKAFINSNGQKVPKR